MRSRTLVLLNMLLMLVTASTAGAQPLTDSTRTHVVSDSLDLLSATGNSFLENKLSLGFDHVLSLYDWHAGIALGRVTPQGAEYIINFTADSRLRQENSSVTTQGTGFIRGAYPLGAGSPFRPFIALYGTSYATSSSPGKIPTASLITQQADGFGIAGLRTRLSESGIDLSIGAGLARQNQAIANTTGSIVRAELEVPGERVAETSDLTGSTVLDERFYRSRSQRYSNDRIDMHLASGLTSGLTSAGPPDRNDATLMLWLQRRDFFFTLDSASEPAKQERTELALLLADSLRYPIWGERLMGNIAIEFEPRSVSRTSDVALGQMTSAATASLSSLLVPNTIASQRFALLGRMNLSTDLHSPWTGLAQLRYEERSQNVKLSGDRLASLDPATVRKLSSTLEQASFASRTAQTSLGVGYALSGSDTATLEGNTRLLNYDTPSDENHDDHDELLTGLRFTYGHTFSRRLASSAELRASRSHLVYLKSDRSAQNNVTRSLALITQTVYDGYSFYGVMRGEVFANYTVLDYLDSLPILQSVGSYVLRGLTVHDTMVLRSGLTPVSGMRPLTIELSSDLRINERGGYQRQPFTERRDTRIAELTGAALLGLHYDRGTAPWSLRAGIRGFLLSRSGQSEISLTEQQNFSELERQTRIGPFATLDLYQLGPTGPSLTATAWYAVIKSEEFGSAIVTRTPQFESHLHVDWRF